ncbi:MAG TPA: hypothetical protein VE544_00300 [Nitrososphaeraceae archaeon]|nr:hypothetical protein [Nitrososphaeraceae archaeon]
MVAASSALGLSYMLSETEPSWASSNDDGASGDGIVYIAPFYELEGKVPDEVKGKFAQIKEQILNGTIKIPERYKETPSITIATPIPSPRSDCSAVKISCESWTANQG